jgi:hypothetical protein
LLIARSDTNIDANSSGTLSGFVMSHSN